METNAQHILFNEITRPKVFIIRDLYLPSTREEINEYTGEPEIIQGEEEYIKYGEYTIKGFPVANTFFPYLLKLGKDFIQEVKANANNKSIDYVKYVLDLKIELEKLLSELFQDFHGLKRYKYIKEIVHVDFMHNDYHLKIENIDRESDIHIKVQEFSTKLQQILQNIQEEFNIIFSKHLRSEAVDNRIKCNASKQEIQDYFYQLDWQNTKGNQILTREQIDHFLQVNFQGFDVSTDKISLNPIGLTQADIRYFIYDFIIKLDPKGNRKKYAQICKDNFDQFKKEEVEVSTIASNFSKKPKKYFLD